MGGGMKVQEFLVCGCRKFVKSPQISCMIFVWGYAFNLLHIQQWLSMIGYVVKRIYLSGIA